MTIRLSERATIALRKLYSAELNPVVDLIDADADRQPPLPLVAAFYGHRRESDQVDGKPVFDCWDGEITFFDQVLNPGGRAGFYAQCFVRVTYAQSQQWSVEQFEAARARYLAALATVAANNPTYANDIGLDLIRANSDVERDDGGMGFKFRSVVELRVRIEEIA